ncbi:MAG: SRPBCC family protein [Pseudomonadota bacterium]
MNAPSPSALPPHLRLFSELLDHVRHGAVQETPQDFEIPVEYYTDPEWFERERRELFRGYPIIVGHAAMLRKPGEHFTHDALGAPILVAKGRDGKIRAFYNVCRHRGVRLVDEEDVQRRSSFVCPYHHWRYGLDGALQHAPLSDELFKGIDLSCRGLRPIPCVVRRGFIWVQLDGLPDDAEPDVATHLDTIDSDFQAFGMEEQHFYRRSITTRKANWKLIVDAFQDGYHVVRLHQKTVGPFFIDGGALQERAGLNMRAAVARKELLQLIEDGLDTAPDSWRPRHHTSFAHFIFPNTVMVFHPDYTSQLGLFPTSAGETVVIHQCFIPSEPKTDKERKHWERAFSMVEDGVFHAEDYYVCESTQRGLHSGANKTHLVGAMETGVAMFREILRDVMGPLPGDRR